MSTRAWASYLYWLKSTSLQTEPSPSWAPSGEGKVDSQEGSQGAALLTPSARSHRPEGRRGLSEPPSVVLEGPHLCRPGSLSRWKRPFPPWEPPARNEESSQPCSSALLRPRMRVCKVPLCVGLAIPAFLIQGPHLAPGQSWGSNLPDMRLLCSEEHFQVGASLGQECLDPGRVTAESSLCGTPLLWRQCLHTHHSGASNWCLSNKGSSLHLTGHSTLGLRPSHCWQLWGIAKGISSATALPGHSREQVWVGLWMTCYIWGGCLPSLYSWGPHFVSCFLD